MTSEGCEVILACGIHFYFPPGAASDSVRIDFRTLEPDPRWVKLQHHDVLLSRVLELQPHGVTFQQVRAQPSCPPSSLPLPWLGGVLWEGLPNTITFPIHNPFSPPEERCCSSICP